MTPSTWREVFPDMAEMAVNPEKIKKAELVVSIPSYNEARGWSNTFLIKPR
jgi:hypothetical protein